MPSSDHAWPAWLEPEHRAAIASAGHSRSGLTFYDAPVILTGDHPWMLATPMIKHAACQYLTSYATAKVIMTAPRLSVFPAWDLKRPLIHDVRWVFGLVQGQAGSGEAAFDKAGMVLDLLQAVPDLFTASSRTCSRRRRLSGVSPPPCAYRMHPAYRRKPHASAPDTAN